MSTNYLVDVLDQECAEMAATASKRTGKKVEVVKHERSGAVDLHEVYCDGKPSFSGDVSFVHGKLSAFLRGIAFALPREDALTPTKVVINIISNQKGFYDWTIRQAKDYRHNIVPKQKEVKSGKYTAESCERYGLADEITDKVATFLDKAGDGQPSPARELVAGLVENALENVDFEEVATHFLGILDEIEGKGEDLPPPSVEELIVQGDAD